MRTITRNRKVRAWLALVVASAGLTILTSSPASAAAVTIDLCAKAGTISLPGAPSVPIWGFGIPTTPGDCSTATATLPGPVLEANEGDTVTINVTDSLPPAPVGPMTHTLSFEIPGADFNTGPMDAAVGATVTRTFTASRPGTYIYQSGGDAGRQEAMGLYGALIVRPPQAGQAYHPATTAYNVESTLVLSQLDPNFNAAPDTFDMTGYLATYWMINGQAYSDTTPTTQISALANERVLLRYVNAGYDNSSMMLLGARQTVVGRDGYLLDDPIDADAETIPAGGTEDAIVTVPSYLTAPSTDGFPLFNRNLHVTNGTISTVSPVAYSPGGMLIFINQPLQP